MKIREDWSWGFGDGGGGGGGGVRWREDDSESVLLLVSDVESLDTKATQDWSAPTGRLFQSPSWNWSGFHSLGRLLSGHFLFDCIWVTQTVLARKEEDEGDGSFFYFILFKDWKDKKRAIVNQTNTRTVWKATLGKLNST